MLVDTWVEDSWVESLACTWVCNVTSGRLGSLLGFWQTLQQGMNLLYLPHQVCQFLAGTRDTLGPLN